MKRLDLTAQAAAFYIDWRIIDPATGKIGNHVKNALTWSDVPLGNWTTPVYLVAIPAPEGVTEAMVTAYLTANDAYWKRTDELPATNPSKWRNGTPREATRESLQAALKAAHPGERKEGE